MFKWMKTKGFSFPFICFHLFFGIGAFQRVTTDSNNFFLISRPHTKLCATVMPSRFYRSLGDVDAPYSLKRHSTRDFCFSEDFVQKSSEAVAHRGYSSSPSSARSKRPSLAFSSHLGSPSCELMGMSWARLSCSIFALSSLDSSSNSFKDLENSSPAGLSGSGPAMFPTSRKRRSAFKVRNL